MVSPDEEAVTQTSGAGLPILKEFIFFWQGVEASPEVYLLTGLVNMEDFPEEPGLFFQQEGCCLFLI